MEGGRRQRKENKEGRKGGKKKGKARRQRKEGREAKKDGKKWLLSEMVDMLIRSIMRYFKMYAQIKTSHCKYIKILTC